VQIEIVEELTRADRKEITVTKRRRFTIWREMRKI
jgi:hypothetical protein